MPGKPQATVHRILTAGYRDRYRRCRAIGRTDTVTVNFADELCTQLIGKMTSGLSS
jgi:hypothetical protein